MLRPVLLAVLSAISALFLFLAPGHAADGATVRFERAPLSIVTADGKRHTFDVELAVTDAQRQHGLMFRETMAADEGMLFDFGTPRRITMWMRNTILPLDMIFIDPSGEILSIHKDAEPFSESIIDSGAPAAFVLELNAGITGDLNIRRGDRVENERIPLR
ncbi:hypothetical protein SAMN05880582_101438 [Rhizobium sp. RU20A]|uniref:DUF192 domain-containing protein n=1 Tax=Rhizobium sp. RU20A TaxID=1907412 RepID=UPI000953E12B|nr:DUF192 domain-containing protein [Rhizobium sp. RU20A]SIQ02695.1 hypothetical protein SAMN05880582_101438 [Rhizobium sp. RU20A]